ncbi:MAG: helix-turn-helix domain-containing protein [Lentisphaeria bacterium]
MRVKRRDWMFVTRLHRAKTVGRDLSILHLAAVEECLMLLLPGRTPFSRKTRCGGSEKEDLAAGSTGCKKRCRDFCRVLIDIFVFQLESNLVFVYPIYKSDKKHIASKGAGMRKVKAIPMGPPNLEFFKPAPGSVQGSVEISMRTWRDRRIENRPLYPYTVEIATRTGRHWFRERNNRYCLIIMLLRGALRYTFAGKNRLLCGNQVLLIPQGRSFSFETLGEDSYQKLSLYVLGVNLPEILETFGLSQITLLTLPDLKQITADIMEIRELLEPNRPEMIPRLAGLSMKILAYLAEFRQGPETSPMILNIAKSRLATGFDLPVNLETLAEELGVSSRTLVRLFKAGLGVTPSAFRKQHRFAAAKALLADDSLTIKEVADRLGFCNQFHFSREFRSFFGLSPSEFRRNG